MSTKLGWKLAFSALCAFFMLAMPASVGAQVRGYVDGTFPDGAGGYFVRGWACQTGHAQSITVHMYVGGRAGTGTYAGAATANQASESGVAAACQSTGTAYRYNLPLTASVRQTHGGKSIHVHGLSPIGTGNPTLTQSGVYLVPRPVAAIRRYTYNGRQELCKVYEPETGVTVMAYDGAGNLAWSAGGLNLTSHNSCNESNVSAGRKAIRTYDARNRLTALAFADGHGNQTWTYTPDGLPATITSPYDSGSRQVVNSYVYNRRRMLAREQQALTSWGAFYVDYLYNANGHLSGKTYRPEFNIPAIDYAPNALGQPTKAGTYATGVSYFPNGAIKQFTYGNGIVHTLTQNERGLPLVSRDANGSSALIDDAYEYDQNGNVLAITDGAAGRNQRGNRDMTYDALDRLTQTVSGNGAGATTFGTATYAYDVLDNLTRTVVTGGGSTRNHYYCYNANWQLANVKTGSCGGTTVVGLGYDLQGNLNNKNGQTYSFDLGNRLRAVPGKEDGYAYDAHGRRVISIRYVSGSGALRSIYGLDGQLMFQQDQGEAKRKDFVYLGNNLIAQRILPNTGAATPVSIRYQHTDALGSPVVVTNEAKVVVERSDLEPYGQVALRTGSPMPRNGVGYTGHVEDAATGLNYMQQRYYDPEIGRFLSVDPVTAYSDPVAMFNRYKYAANNPYRFGDPDGRAESPAWMRAMIPGQVTWDHAVTSAEQGNYGRAAALGVAAIAEGVAGIVMLGQSQAALAPVRVVAQEVRVASEVAETVTKVNPRTLIGRQGPSEMSGNQVKRLASDMKANGYNQSKPIDIANVDGKKIIIDGHHRAAAAIKAGVSEVPVNTIPTTSQQGSQLLQEAAEAKLIRGR